MFSVLIALSAIDQTTHETNLNKLISLHELNEQFLWIPSLISVNPAYGEFYSKSEPKFSVDGYGVIFSDIEINAGVIAWSGYIEITNVGERDIGKFRIIFLEKDGSANEVSDMINIKKGDSELIEIPPIKNTDSPIELLIRAQPPVDSGDPTFVFHSVIGHFPAGFITPTYTKVGETSMYSFSSTETYNENRSMLIESDSLGCHDRMIDAYGEKFDNSLTGYDDETIKISFQHEWSPDKVNLACSNIPNAAFPINQDIIVRIVDSNYECKIDVCKELVVKKDKDDNNKEVFIADNGDLEYYFNILKTDIMPFASPAIIIMSILFRIIRGQISVVKEKKPEVQNRGSMAIG